LAKIRKKRIRWNPSPDPDVRGYRLYWTLLEGVNHNSAFVNVGDVTEVILPDNVPAFPLIAGEMEFGVTAVNQAGNESDMAVFSANVYFVPPGPPTNLRFEDIQQNFHKETYDGDET
jgi:hypothetical protein